MVFKKKKAKIDPAEVEDLLARMRAYEEGPKVVWEVGAFFKVAHGPFKGFSGKVTEVEQDRDVLHTMVRIFGRDTPIQLHPMDIERAP